MRSLISAALLLASCGPVAPEPEPEIWRFAIEENRGSVQDAYARRFEELVEARTDGAVDVVVYPYGTLGTSDQVTELLYLNAVQLAMASPGHVGKLIPEVQVFLLHYVLSPDPDVNSRALADPALHATLGDLYRDKGLELLSIYSEGWQVWTTQEPVRTPDDFRGVKIRTMTSPLLLASYAAYGASPTPLPYSEVYSALQLSMIDAQVNPIFAIQEMSFHEVTDAMVFADHAEFVTTAVAGGRFYDGLTPDHRALVDDVIDELQPWILDLQRRSNAERLDRILTRRPDMEVVHLSAQEQAAFREASLPVRDRYVEIAGGRSEQVLQQLLSAVASAEREVPQEE